MVTKRWSPPNGERWPPPNGRSSDPSIEGLSWNLMKGISKEMLVSRDELRFDFRGARFNPEAPNEKKFLGWVFNQFLYGEVTGIQCGYWLYRAPHLNAAIFLAKQAGEELSHFRKFLRILS